MASIRKRLERNQQVITEQRRIDRKFVIKSRRIARDWNEYFTTRFGDLYKGLPTGKGDAYERRAMSGRTVSVE